MTNNVIGINSYTDAAASVDVNGNNNNTYSKRPVVMYDVHRKRGLMREDSEKSV